MSNKNKSVQKAQRRKKLHAIEMFGGKCQICGYDRCPNALEFHHLSEKEESPSYVIMRWEWEKAKKELEKCILVCSNCHREIHYLDLNIDFVRLLKPWIVKKCKVCNKEYETKLEEQQYCSQFCFHFGSRKIERPTKDELSKLISELPFTQIGKMFGVSDNAVRKWAKKYDLTWN